jgi:hypothetical protein
LRRSYSFSQPACSRFFSTSADPEQYMF